MSDINKKIKKIAKEAAKNIVDELDENGWFVSSSYGDIGCYEKELKAIIKKACKETVKNGYKKGMTKDVIKETVNIASESISHSISLYDDYYDSYKSNLKPYVKEALKSCDKLHKFKKLCELSDLDTKLRKIEQNKNCNSNTTLDGVTEEYFGIFSNVIDDCCLDADQIGMDEEYEL